MAAGATYEPIATNTLSSITQSITFSSIPSTYTDLRLVFVGKTNTSEQYVGLRYNGDTGTNYSVTTLAAGPSTVGSGKGSNNDRIYPNLYAGPSVGLSTTGGLYTFDILSYTGSTNKICLATVAGDRNGSGDIDVSVGLWRDTSAINSLTLVISSTPNFAIGSIATLYGIKAA